MSTDATLDRLAFLLRTDAQLADRTAAWLDTLEDPPMPERQTAIRLPEDFYERADAIAERLVHSSAELRALGVVTRTAVLRLAIARGLEALEREHGLRAWAAVQGGAVVAVAEDPAALPAGDRVELHATSPEALQALIATLGTERG